MCGGQECGYELKKYQFITNGFICIPLGCFGLLRDRWYFGESFFFVKPKITGSFNLNMVFHCLFHFEKSLIGKSAQASL